MLIYSKALEGAKNVDTFGSLPGPLTKNTPFRRTCFCAVHGTAYAESIQSRRHFLRSCGTLLLSVASLRSAFAQERWNQGLDNTCSFYPNDVVNADVFTFGSPEEGLDVVTKITSMVGLQPNFDVLQANVPNAAAVIREGRRYILYSQVFIDQIRQQATEWAAWTIMAHEVGHHLNGHTLLATGSRPPIELEADRFAGFAVNRMGATLQQALSPYQQMSEQGSQTHPPRSARLEAVTAGWHQAGGAPQPPEDDPSPPTAANPAGLLQSVIEQLQTGQLPQVPMSAELQQAVSTQLPQAAPMLQQLGEISEIQLQNQMPTPDGGNLYFFGVQFAGGGTVWQLGVAPTGTLTSLFFRFQ